MGEAGQILHIAVWFEQVVTFRLAPFSIAFGVYVPSHKSIKCKLYNCLMPNFAASLSATSPSMPSKYPRLYSTRDIVCDTAEKRTDRSNSW
jgi:hypothetical protein